MTAARIARGGGARVARPRAKQSGRGTNVRRAKQPGLLEQAGIAPATVRRAMLWILVGLIAAAAVAAVAAFRVPQRVGLAMAEAVGDAGFTVRSYEIRGVERMDRRRVDAVVASELSKAMPLVDLAALRQRLLAFGWVGDARVSRRLPDTLVIDIVERRPAAIWQNEQRLMLIDASGVVLDHVRIDAQPVLPRLIGQDANRQIGSLGRILAASGHLRPQVDHASWIGGRRWDVAFQSGELLALPEGEEAAAAAIAEFARRDQQAQLLGRGFVRFDMRVPGRMTVRVSREPGGGVPALAPEAPAAAAPGTPPEDLTNTI